MIDIPVGTNCASLLADFSSPELMCELIVYAGVCCPDGRPAVINILKQLLL